jgi:UDP-galactose transporter B1
MCPHTGQAFVNALLAYSVCSALGQCFIYFAITEFSPLLGTHVICFTGTKVQILTQKAAIVSTVTTTRKIFSTVYSVFRDPSNSLNEMQWMGCGLVFFGILFEMVAGAMKPHKAKVH